MCASGWPTTLLLFCLLGSATSSPVSIDTPAPALLSQISPPSPSLSSPSLGTPPSIPPLISNSGESAEEVGCPLRTSPSTLVVRFGDPVTANCSVSRTGFSALGWEVSLEPPEVTMDRFLVWSVERMTQWSITPMCYALSELGGQCHIHLPVIVYQPPDNVSISFVNHTGPLSEGRLYTVQCLVEHVAPAGNLTVTFYKGQTVLDQQLSNNSTEKEPVTEIFTLNITPSNEDDGVQFWCEAKLELGPDGPQPPPLMKSQKLSAAVLFGPQLVCPTKLQVKEGKSCSCEVRGNPQPSVTWFRDGRAVDLPRHLSRKHAGNYIVYAEGHLGQKNFTVEVEVLAGRGTTNSCKRHFLLAVLLVINWL